MPLTAAKKTWVLVLGAPNVLVFETAGSAEPLKAIRELESPSLQALARYVDQGRRARDFERFMIVGPAESAGDLLAELSRPTRALFAITRPDVVLSLALRQRTESGPTPRARLQEPAWPLTAATPGRIRCR